MLKHFTCWSDFVDEAHDGGAGLEGAVDEGGVEARVSVNT